MAKSTGPALMIGGITMFNDVILNNQAFNWHIPVATGIVALGLAGLEHLSPELAVGLAWTALVAILFTRVNPAVPAPAESMLALTKGSKV
jgi:hypothetical protein